MGRFIDGLGTLSYRHVTWKPETEAISFSIELEWVVLKLSRNQNGFLGFGPELLIRRMTFESLITAARQNGASDLHLEGGLPAAMRIRGALRTVGEAIPSAILRTWAIEQVGEAGWLAFEQRCSADISRTIQGVRCRFNIFQTARGIGMAIRLHASFQATVESLNLHLDLKKLVTHRHGLILVCGPTGSGKSSTLAALLQEINLTETRHIVTIENPIEYHFQPRHAFIRQREVGRDTPSFEQALIDALREDPDVLMVGEMREPETMRLTLNASETGHLVLSTVHSSNCAEALQRVVSAFPPEIQGNVSAQLADCLVAVVSQRLQFRPDINLRIPVCEVLTATHAIRNMVRTREYYKVPAALETGADHGMWSFVRYQAWVDARDSWHNPTAATGGPASEAESAMPRRALSVPPPVTNPIKDKLRLPDSGTPPVRSGHRIEIDIHDAEFGKILKPNSPR